MVGDDQGVASEHLAGICLMFKPAKQPFFGQQAFQESKVALPILHGHAALGVGGGSARRHCQSGTSLPCPFQSERSSSTMSMTLLSWKR
jgi:hypothetical protein